MELPGYTTYMLESLRRTRIFHVGPQEMKSFGHPAAPAADVVRRCLQRMGRYVKVAIAVVVAEFPSWDLCSSFQIFALSETADGALGREELLWHTNTEAETCFQRLSTFFHVSARALKT